MTHPLLTVSKGYRPLVKAALAQGWTLTQSNRGHPEADRPRRLRPAHSWHWWRRGARQVHRHPTTKARCDPVTDDSDPRRDKTRAFFQDLGPVEPVDNGSILTGWVVVQEWMHPDGHKFLLRGWDHAIPSWTAKGMIHEVLYGDWPDAEE